MGGPLSCCQLHTHSTETAEPCQTHPADVTAIWPGLVNMPENIRAVHRAEIADFFERLGLAEDLEASRLQCSICGDVITTSNFMALSRKNGRLVFCCTKRECYMLFAGDSDENTTDD